MEIVVGYDSLNSPIELVQFFEIVNTKTNVSFYLIIIIILLRTFTCLRRYMRRGLYLYIIYSVCIYLYITMSTCLVHMSTKNDGVTQG